MQKTQYSALKQHIWYRDLVEALKYCHPASHHIAYLAYVKLQTSHVPLNGFNLLQKDRDGTQFTVVHESVVTDGFQLQKRYVLYVQDKMRYRLQCHAHML